jgi:hypothetical protein
MNAGASSGNSTTTTEIPDWIKNPWQELYGRADDVYQHLSDDYKSQRAYYDPGQRVAGLNEDQFAGIDLAKQNAFGGLDWLSRAKEGVEDVMNGGAGSSPINFNPAIGISSQSAPDASIYSYQGPQAARASPITSQSTPESSIYSYAGPQAALASYDFERKAPDASAYNFQGPQRAYVDGVSMREVQAGTLPGTNLSQYTNPHEDMVVSRAMGDIDQQRQRMQNENRSNATAQGAWGGSGFGGRFGVTEGATNEAALDAMADMSGQLRQAGYDRATGLASADIDRTLGANLDNASRAMQIGTNNAQLQQQTNLAGFGANVDKARSIFDANFQQGRANQDAINSVQENNTARQQQANLAGFGAGVDKARTMYDTAVQTGFKNMDAWNAGVENNATREQQANLARFGADVDRSGRIYDTEAQYGLANMAAYNDLQKFNSDGSMRAGIADAQRLLDNTGLEMGAADRLSQLAAQRQNMGLTGAGVYSGAGGQQQATEQQLRDAQYEEFNRRRTMPYEALTAMALPFGVQPNQLGGTSNTNSKGKSGGVALGGG